MNYRNEIYDGTFDDIQHSSVIQGMSKRSTVRNLQDGINLLNTYDAKQEDPYPTGGCGILVLGTTIPLSMEDKDKLYSWGWYEQPKWPPDSKSIEQYGFNTVKCYV